MFPGTVGAHVQAGWQDLSPCHMQAQEPSSLQGHLSNSLKGAVQEGCPPLTLKKKKASRSQQLPSDKLISPLERFPTHSWSPFGKVVGKWGEQNNCSHGQQCPPGHTPAASHVSWYVDVIGKMASRKCCLFRARKCSTYPAYSRGAGWIQSIHHISAGEVSLSAGSHFC